MNTEQLDSATASLVDTISLETLVNRIPAIEPTLPCEQLASCFARYKTESLVVAVHGQPVGFLHHKNVAEALSTQFGYALYQKRPVTELMLTKFLCIELVCSMSDVVRQAMEREQDSLYEDIVVVQDGQYVGLLAISRVIEQQRQRINDQVKMLERNKNALEQMNEELRRALEDLHTTEAQLMQAEKMASIGTLAAGVAHDFNNMLGAILSAAHMIKKKLPSDSPLQRYCSMIENATQRSASLTKQLLEFSQKNIVSIRVISANDVIRETVQMLERSIGKSINIQLHLDDSIEPIEADDTQIQQVLMNLALNARDAMPAGGSINISTKMATMDIAYCRQHPFLTPGEYVQLSIRDTGFGIKPEHLPRIFDPFFTTKDIGKGTGLGLSVVYGIIQRHKGHINVYSEVGKGTRFTIYFKPARKGVAQSERQVPTEEVVRGQGTILYVDDEEMLLQVNADFLETLGYNVYIAPSGFHAIDIFRVKHADIGLVLLDMSMPNMDGRRTFRELRAIEPSVKVLFVSGFTDEEHFKTVMEEGAVDLVRKPFDHVDLSKKIKTILQGEEVVKRD